MKNYIITNKNEFKLKKGKITNNKYKFYTDINCIFNFFKTTYSIPQGCQVEIDYTYSYYEEHHNSIKIKCYDTLEYQYIKFKQNFLNIKDYNFHKNFDCIGSAIVYNEDDYFSSNWKKYTFKIPTLNKLIFEQKYRTHYGDDGDDIEYVITNIGNEELFYKRFVIQYKDEKEYFKDYKNNYFRIRRFFST